MWRLWNRRICRRYESLQLSKTRRQGDKEKSTQFDSPCLPLSCLPFLLLMRRVLHIIDSLDRTDAAHQLRVLAKGLAREGVEVEIAALDAIKDPPPLTEPKVEGSED